MTIANSLNVPGWKYSPPRDQSPASCVDGIPPLHGESPMTFTLAPLPWNEDALEPVISAKTISFHYHKHHQTYVDTLNKLVEKTKFADMKLENIVQATAGAKDEAEKKI